jgi:hypothetical protein
VNPRTHRALLRVTRGLIVAMAAAPLVAWALQVPPGVVDTTRAARELLDTLDARQRTALVQPLNDAGEERTSWSYLPGRRPGIALKDLDERRRAAVFALLRSSLSEQGMKRTEGVIVLEGVLRELSTFGGGRDPDLYYLTFFGEPAGFGEPSGQQPWSYRFEGHHLSLHFSSASGRLIASTPFFFGAQPTRVLSGPHAGLRVLGDQDDAARRLFDSLDPAQRRTAIIETSAPGDIILSPGRKSVPDPQGLAASQMTPDQYRLLRALIEVYTNNLRGDQARAQMARIEKAGTEKIRFAWAGGTRPGDVFYYRVQGPTFVIEYDVTNRSADHVHSVYRDLEHDFGGDVLRQHYAQSPHHADRRPAS